MGKQNERLLENMKELDKQKLPKWFTGELYKEGYKHEKQYIIDLENKLATIQRIADHG